MSSTADSQSLGFVQVPIVGLNEYPENVPATEMVRYDQFVLQLFEAGSRTQMAVHASFGCAAEAGLLSEALRRIHNERCPDDRQLVVEKLGDLRYYMQALANVYGITEQEILQMNALKHTKKYVDLKYGSEDHEN